MCPAIVNLPQHRIGGYGYHDEREQRISVFRVRPFVVQTCNGEETAVGTLYIVRAAQTALVVMRLEKSRYRNDAAPLPPQFTPRPRGEKVFRLCILVHMLPFIPLFLGKGGGMGNKSPTHDLKLVASVYYHRVGCGVCRTYVHALVQAIIVDGRPPACVRRQTRFVFLVGQHETRSIHTVGPAAVFAGDIFRLHML